MFQLPCDPVHHEPGALVQQLRALAAQPITDNHGLVAGIVYLNQQFLRRAKQPSTPIPFAVVARHVWGEDSKSALSSFESRILHAAQIAFISRSKHQRCKLSVNLVHSKLAGLLGRI